MAHGSFDFALELRQKQTGIYKNVIAITQLRHQKSAIMAFFGETTPELLCEPLTLEVTANCSCGRFFEQHPTIIEDTEGERLEIFLHTLLQGNCKCIMLNSDLKAGRDSTNKSSKTWLHVAAALGSQELMEVLLMKSPQHLNTATSLYCHTPLSLAVMQTKGELVSWLCNQPEINPNIKSKNEKHTPLVDAILAEKYHIVEILVNSSKVDVNAVSIF
ncbi:ankyrin repeat-containing domain [Elysia marginata]|uniref:Ankyrin repeat-containing domain n=1 Tax=Elysia marginata TaxID=1093978 RepID=A0AAV4FFF3_9GAST|nr:ankyrin repeat-containing domain [Elysia marginata]